MEFMNTVWLNQRKVEIFAAGVFYALVIRAERFDVAQKRQLILLSAFGCRARAKYVFYWKETFRK